MLKKYFDASFLLTNIILPLVAAIVYCFSFAFVSSKFLPIGVNYVFVNRMGQYNSQYL